MIKKLLLLLFILSTLSYSAHSQDDARIGATFAKTIRLGPATYDFGGENQYEGYKFGVEYMKRFSDKGRYAFNLSYATYDLEINKVTGSIFNGDPVGAPYLKDNFDLISLDATLSFEYDWMIYIFGLILEYDISGIDHRYYKEQNGLGLFMGIGYDLHLSPKIVMTFSPTVRYRSLINFSKNDKKYISSFGEVGSPGLIELQIGLAFAYKFF